MYHFPPSITICGGKIDISYTSRHQGALCQTSLSSKLSLESVIMANAVQKMGFIIWLLNYFFCMYCPQARTQKREKTKYFIVSSDETRKLNFFEELANAYFVVSRFCDILDLNNIEEQEVKYTLQFLSTTSTLTNIERKKVLRKHKSVKKREVVSANRRKLYKEILQSKSAHKYKEMDTGKKHELSKKNALKYKEMDQDKKNELSKKNSLKYKNIDKSMP